MQSGVPGFGEDGRSPAIYFFGIIDMLQMYDVSKSLENFYKTRVLWQSSEGVSAVHADKYAQRFLRSISSKIQ